MSLSDEIVEFKQLCEDVEDIDIIVQFFLSLQDSAYNSTLPA